MVYACDKSADGRGYFIMSTKAVEAALPMTPTAQNQAMAGQMFPRVKQFRMCVKGNGRILDPKPTECTG